jgi:hypothetical protein
MTNGMDAILWSIDCPHRETCLRFIHAFQPDEPSHISYISHHHKPDQPCPDLLETTHPLPTMNTPTPSQSTRGYHPDQIRSIQKILTIAATTPSHIADIFVNFAPHCNALYVHAYTHGWTDTSPSVPHSFSEYIYLDSTHPGQTEKLTQYLLNFIAAIEPAQPIIP